MLLTNRPVNLTDTVTVHTGNALTRPLGIGHRTALDTSGNLFLVVRIDSDQSLRVIKQPLSDPGGAQTITSGVAGHTVLTANTFQSNIACAAGDDDILHIVFMTDTGGVKAIKYVPFSMTALTWGTEQTIQTGVGSATVTAFQGIDICVDKDNVPHVAWHTYMTTDYRLYYSVRTAGTWATPTLLDAAVVGPTFCPRIDVDDADRVLVLADDAGAWTAFEAGVTQALAGYGQAEVTHTSDNVRHIVFASDKRHTTIAGQVSTFATTVGAIKYEHPDSDGGDGADNKLKNLGVRLVADGHVLHILAAARGKLYQGSWDGEYWTMLREIANITEDLGKRDTIIIDSPARMITSTELWAAYKIDWTSDNGTPTACWSVAHLDTTCPPRGNITHHIVIDDVGYMTGSPLAKADISQAVPRVSVATEVRKEENLSDLSSVTQSSFHHGRGEREFANPLAFLDSDYVLTHIPDQVTPQYAASTSAKDGGGDFDGYPVDMILYQGNLYMLIRGTAFGANALYVWDNTDAEWDTVAAGLDTTNATPQDLEIYNEDLWVAQGDTDNARVYNFSGTAWADGGVPAYCFKEWDGKLWRADNINEIYFSADADNITTATWTLLGTVDDGAGTTSRIRGFEAYAGSLLVFADFGVYQIISNGNGTYTMLPLLNDESQRHTNNGRAHTNFGGTLFYNVQDGVTRFDGSTRSEVGPNRSPIAADKFAPMLTTERGTPSSMVATDNFMYMSITPDDTSTGRGQVMINGGTGWHKFFKSTVDGERVMFVFFTPKLTATGVLSKRTLWVNQGDVVKYIPLPTIGENPLHDSTMVYMTEDAGNPRLITGWSDDGLAALYKVIHEMAIRADNLVPHATDYNVVDIYFQSEAGTDSFTLTNWTYLATFDGAPEETIRITERVKKLNGPEASGSVGGLAYRRIRFLLDIRSRSTSAPVVLRSFTKRFAPRTQSRYGFTAVVNCFEELIRLDAGMDAGMADELRRRAYSLQLQKTPHYVDDGTLIPVVNQVLNSGFEVDSALDGLADNWTARATVTTARSSKHTRSGRYSQKVTVAVNQTAAAGVYQALTVPRGCDVRLGVSIFVESGTGVCLQLIASDGTTVIAQTSPVWPVSSHRSTAHMFDLMLDVPAASLTASTSYFIQVAVPLELVQTNAVGSCVYYVDDAFTYYGEEPPEYYIDGTMARCQWSEPVLNDTGGAITALSITGAGNSQSVQRRQYAVHVTGLTESFRHRKGPGKLDSQITLFMREASG